MSKDTNFKVIKPNWVVPDNVHALQTIKNLTIDENLLNNDRIQIEDNVGIRFLRSKNKVLNQIHSNISVELPSKSLDADASYTFKKNIICAVRTADCMPILVTNDEGSFVSAIHAGWRGLSTGVIEKTIKKLSPIENLIVWIGPHISQKHFEVGSEVKEIFLNYDPTYEVAFNQSSNSKYFFSLKTVAEIKLHKLGVKNIYCMDNFCTYANPKIFYSYRRGDLKERMTSLIWIES